MILEFKGVKPTTRLYLLLLLMSFIIVSDLLINGGISWFSLTIISILIALILSLYMLIDTLSVYHDKLIVKREFLDPLVEDKLVRVRVRFDNKSIFPFFKILANDVYPDMFRVVRGDNKALLFIPSNGSATYTYIVKPVVGEHVFKGVELVVFDPLELFNYRVLVDPEINTVRVKPKPYPLPRKIAITWPSRGLGLGRTKIRGVGQEFYSLREYQPGDEYRFIDWKSFARRRRLYVKEFVREANLSIIFLIDATTYSMRGLIGETPLEYMTRLVASLSNLLIKRGDWIALTIRSDQIIRSGYGHGYIHYYNILNTLSRIKWKRFIPNRSLGEILVEEALRIPRRSKTLFFVMTSMLDEYEATELVKAYNTLYEKGHLVYVVLLQPALFELNLLKGLDAGVYTGVIYEDILSSKKISEFLIRKGVATVIAGRDTLFDSIYRLIEEYRMVIA